jgi:spermidine synthase
MFDTQSEFQRVQVIETEPFGKTLVLDGKTQSAQGDEFVYHECLVHPAMLLHANPKSVYIGGGGELATAREALRHTSVERVVMVDLDKVVVDVCREWLDEWNAGSTEDPRLELHYDDAHAWLRSCDETFDVIVMDIADPIEAGPGYVLYTEEFYRFALTKLNPGGIIVTQSGPGAIYNPKECFTAIHQTLKQAFSTVVPYTVNIPSFGCDWAFNLAFNDDMTSETKADLMERSAAQTDALIEARLRPAGTAPLRFLDGVSHRGIFGIPLPVRQALEAEERIITVDNPVFMY